MRERHRDAVRFQHGGDLLLCGTSMGGMLALELVRQARGAKVPESFYHDPLMYQGGSDDLRGARAPITLADEAWGCDMEGEVAVITDDTVAATHLMELARAFEVAVEDHDLQGLPASRRRDVAASDCGLPRCAEHRERVTRAGHGGSGCLCPCMPAGFHWRHS